MFNRFRSLYLSCLKGIVLSTALVTGLTGSVASQTQPEKENFCHSMDAAIYAFKSHRFVTIADEKNAAEKIIAAAQSHHRLEVMNVAPRAICDASPSDIRLCELSWTNTTLSRTDILTAYTKFSKDVQSCLEASHRRGTSLYASDLQTIPATISMKTKTGRQMAWIDGQTSLLTRLKMHKPRLALSAMGKLSATPKLGISMVIKGPTARPKLYSEAVYDSPKLTLKEDIEGLGEVKLVADAPAKTRLCRNFIPEIKGNKGDEYAAMREKLDCRYE